MADVFDASTFKFDDGGAKTFDASSFNFEDEPKTFDGSGFKFEDEAPYSRAQEKVQRTKKELMELEWQARTGRKDDIAGASFANVPFAGSDFEQNQQEKLTRMRDFLEGKPHLEKRLVGNREVTPEEAAQGRSMVYDPEERRDTLDDMRAQEASYLLGVKPEEMFRRDGESRKDYEARLKGAIEAKFKESVGAQEEAKQKLSQTEKTWTDQVVVGGLPAVKYAGELYLGGSLMKGAEGAKLGFDILTKEGLKKLFTSEGMKQLGKVAATKVAADSAKTLAPTVAQSLWKEQELKRDEFGLDQNGNVVVTSKGDEGDTLAKAFRATYTENLLENLVGEVTRPIAGKVFAGIGKHGGPLGRAVSRVYQAYDRMTQKTGFGDILFEELPEENVQYFFSDILGWGKKDSEYKGVYDEWKAAFSGEGQYTAQGQWNTMLAMLLQMGAQTAVAGSKVAIESIDMKRDIGNQLESIGLTKAQVGKMSLEQRAAFANAWNTMRDNPEALKGALEKAGGYLGKMADELTKQTTYKLEKDIEAYGETPRAFQVQTETGEDGKQKPKFARSMHMDGVTGEAAMANEMFDAEAGVTMAEGEDGTYEVRDEIHPERTFTTDDFGEAKRCADLYALTNQKQHLDNLRKAEYAQQLAETKFQRPTEVAEHVTDVYRIVRNGIEAEGSFHGVSDLSQIFVTGRDGEIEYPPRMRGGDSRGFNCPDGTTVLILDNIQSPEDMNRAFMHETAHGAGKEDRAARAEMLSRISPDTEYGRILEQMREINDSLPEEERRPFAALREEAFSRWLEERGHNPSIGQRIRHALFGNIGKLNDADLEVIASRLEQETATAGGGVEFIPADVNADSVPIEEEVQPEAPETTETATVEAVGEAEEAKAGNEPPKEEKPVEAPSRASQAAPENARTEGGFLRVMHDGGAVTRVKSDAIKIPDTQFKEGADPKTGVVAGQELQGEYFESAENAIAVYERKDGTQEVVTGRHRLDLAKRTGHDTILARVFKESDGWTPEDMRTLDAISNIIDEKGSVKDYVKYYSDAKVSRAAAEAGGFLSRPKGKLAFGIYEGATEDTRSAIDWSGSGGDDLISPEQAGIIAEAAPRGANPRFGAVQRVLVKKAQDGLRGKKLGILARSLAEEAKSRKDAPKVDGEMQLDLFTSAEDQALLALEDKRAGYRVKKSAEYSRIAEILRTAIGKGGKLDLNAEYAKELGITDPNDKKQLAAARDKAVERAGYWENAIQLDEADKAAMDAEIGAKAEESAKKRAEAEAKVAEIKAKREGKVAEKKVETKAAKVETKAPVAETKTAKTETPKPVLETEKAVSGTEKVFLGTEKVVLGTETGKKELSKNSPKKPAEVVVAKNETTTTKKRTIVMKSEADEKALDDALAGLDFDDRRLVEPEDWNEYRQFDILMPDGKINATHGYNRRQAVGYAKQKYPGGVVFEQGGAKNAIIARDEQRTRDKLARALRSYPRAAEVAGAPFNLAIRAGILDIRSEAEGRDALRGGGLLGRVGQRGELSGAAPRATEAGWGYHSSGDVTIPIFDGTPNRASREFRDILTNNTAFKRGYTVTRFAADGKGKLYAIAKGPKVAVRAEPTKENRAKFLEDNGFEKFDRHPRTGKTMWRKGALILAEEDLRFGKTTDGEYVALHNPTIGGPLVPGVDFDDKAFDPEVFQKRVGAAAKAVSVLSRNGYKTFKDFATVLAERKPETYAALRPYLRGVWNAVAEQMDLDEVSRGEADRIYGIIEAQTKEVEDGADTRGQHGVDAAEPATSGGEQQPGGVLADRPVREQNPDGRVDGQRSGDVPGLGDGVAKGEASERGEDAGGGTPERAGAVADSAEPQGGEREDGRDSGEDGHNANAHVKKRAKKAADSTKPNPKRRDFVMTKAVEEAILEKKTAQRVRNNLEAIKLIRELKAKDYAATPEEQATLAKFVGWGGLREDVFGYGLERAYDLERSGDVEAAKRHLRREGISQSAYDLHKELRSVLNDSEYESAKASASTAFYTPIYFVEALHDNLRHLGVKGGRFLGPSAGVGNFASAAGEYEKPVNWQFVEKDAMTGEMLKALFPNQRVTIGGFEDTKFPDGFFDFAIDNVPYADVPINDRSLSSKMFKIHDYFFAKTLSKLRPGGVMAFLTSTGTLDKTSPILRQFLTEHGGKIVGAVRLPNGFFSENAGTDVASDLVIVQKVQGRPDNSAFEKGVEYGKTEEWVRRKGRIEKPLTYNGYFQDHPEQIVGKMEIASGQFGPTLKYTMPDVLPGDLSFEISKAIGRALGGIDKDALLKSAAVAEKQDHTPIYDEEGLRQGNVTMKDGKPFIKSGEMLEPITLPNDRTLTKELAKRFKSPTKIMEGLLDLRKAMREVIDAQMADNDMVETDLAPLLAKLNEVYDAFVKKNGTLHDKWVSPFVLLDKADGNRLLALERVVKDENGKPKVVKSDIFTKRVISRGQRATKADTPKDALVISYSEMGTINVPRIAELLGVDHEEAIAKLKEGGDAFENPQTGLLEPSWEYLSGRVRAKLAAARAAVDAGEESYRANIEALEKVQPPMVRLEDAEIKFGATWVDPECMKDFLRDAFGAESMRINLGKNEVTGQWNVEFGRVMNEDPWGETSWSPQEFVGRVLNHGSMNHYDTDPVDKKRYLNERRTEGNKLAAEKLHHAFSQFIQSSDKWAYPMYERYNAVMTDMVEIKLPNNVLPFRAAGMSEATLGKLFEGGDPKQPKKGREYQSDVIARGVLGGNSLCLAHCVGAGKTLEMQSIGVLGRHLGLFKKPMYVVPNHMLEQFANEFVEAFPNANILKMSEADVKPENRRAFFAQVANGDWDAIVVKHSTFSKKLAMSDEYQKEFIEAQRRDLIEAIAAMREAGEKISVDQATKKLERLEAKLEQLANAENHDSQIVPFEELGVDQLFVDEAHNFKGMPITTRQGRTGGLSQGDSQRAVDMQMKTQYVQSLHGGDRGVVFATGTPLSNAPVVEAYVMLKYLAPNKLEEQGLKHFDDFVDAFGRITTESEFSLDGKTVKEKEKVSAFVNIPELMKLLRSVVDIVNPDQLDIPRPKPKYHMIDVDMSPAQEQIMEMVAREAAIPPSREDRNKYLTLTRVAKNVCLTPRLLGYGDGGNKIIRAVAEIKRVYDETAENRGAQLVFTDIFNESAASGSYVDERINYDGKAGLFDEVLVKRSGGTYNLNEEIREMLVAAGIPKDEIAIVQDIDKSKGDKDANKGALFAKVRAGEVRVLIGSRPKMGEGTNVQERLAAIHLLHPGWKPSEDEQAIGRIIRFGNTYKEGQIFYYLTKGNANIGSYETKNHQLIGVKSKLIDQVMHGDDTVREIDMDESAMDRDMLMGLASGNKALMELIDVKKRVHKLELNTESTLTSARRNKDKAEANSRILERRREEFAKEQEGVREWREKNEGKPFTLSTPDGRSIEKVKEMADYVAAQVVKQLTKDRYDRDDKTVLGNFNGVELVLAYDKWGDEKFRLAVPLLGIAREINYSGFIPDFSQGAMTAFKGKIFETVSPDFAKAYENSLADMDRQAKKMSADADKLQKDYEQMRDELIQLRTCQAELERAVTPLVIQAVENRKTATYGNWIITKPGSGRLYVANRESDAKSVSAPTVKELIPLMNAEDFASPRNAATKTIDLRPHLKPNSKGEYPQVDTLSAGQVDFDDRRLVAPETNMTPDAPPTNEDDKKLYGFTNAEIEHAMRAAEIEPPKHAAKSDETLMRQADALLSNREYMRKLAHAVYQKGRATRDYENVALGIYADQTAQTLNAAKTAYDDMAKMMADLPADTDAETVDALKKSLREMQLEFTATKREFREASIAKMQGASEQGRALRSNRIMVDAFDYSYAGLRGMVQTELGGREIPEKMDAEIGKLAEFFKDVDAEQRRMAIERLRLFSQKVVDDLKRGNRTKMMTARSVGNELKRVTKNYNDALNQIEVHADEAGGTLVGLADQLYPSWGKWLKAIGEYHCYLNPDITEQGVIDAIRMDLMRYLEDGIDEESVRDILTGFGQNFRQSRYDSQRKMNDLKAQSLAKRQRDFMMENGRLPPQTGLVRDEPSDETRALRKEVQNLKRDIDQQEGGDRALKGALASAKTRVRNQIADLERAITRGERIERPARTLVEDIELKNLKAERDEKRRIYDEMFGERSTMTDEQRRARLEKMLEKDLERALERLGRAMSGDFSRAAAQSVTSARADELRAAIRETNDQIRELKKAAFPEGTPEEIAKRNERRLAAREKAILRIQDKILNGDIRPNVRKAPPMPEEMQKRYDEMGAELKRAHQKMRELRREARDSLRPAYMRKIGDAYRFIDGIWKMATASLDLTQIGNQTGAIAISHPGVTAKSVVQAMPSFTSEANAENIELDLLTDPMVKEAVDNKWLHWKKAGDFAESRGERVEFFDAIDRGFKIGGRTIRLTDVPVYGTAIANSDRLYATYINTATANLYSFIIRDPGLFPKGASTFEKKMICDMINVMNGSGTLSKKERSSIISKVFWAPGLVDSQLKRHLGYTIWHPWTASAEEDGSGTVKERARMSMLGAKEFLRSHVGAMLLGGLLLALLGRDDDKDRFKRASLSQKAIMLMAPRIGHTQLDFTGGEASFMRLGDKLVTGRKETGSGRTTPINDYFGEIAHFARGRVTPLIGNALATWAGKDYAGQDYGALEVVLSLAPISLRDAGKSIWENGVEDGEWMRAAIGAVATMSGFGKGTYRKDDYKILSGRFRQDYKELTDIQNDPLLDDGEKAALIENIRTTNKLMAEGVVGEIYKNVSETDSLESRINKAIAQLELRRRLGEDVSEMQKSIEESLAKLAEQKENTVRLIRSKR